MSLITRCQRETLVYWAPNSTNMAGELEWHAPVEMTCRWDDKVQEIRTDDGTYVLAKSEVISEIKLEVGGIVFRGTLNDVVYPDTPRDNPNVFRILKVMETPNLRYTERLYEAWA